MRGLDGEVGPLRQQVADLAKEGGVLSKARPLAAVSAVPVVDGSLKLGAAVEEGAVPRPESAHRVGEASPEGFLADTGAGQRLAGHELGQTHIHLQPLLLDPIGQDPTPADDILSQQ